MKNAGRHWRFTFGSKAGSNQTITNQTFIVTLTPLALQSLPNWEVTFKANSMLLSIYVPKCDEVTETSSYFIFQCQNDENRNKFISDRCTFDCPLSESSTYNISVIRLPIPIHHGNESICGTYSEDQRIENIHLGNTI